jgi:hypothetical protein
MDFIARFTIGIFYCCYGLVGILSAPSSLLEFILTNFLSTMILDNYFALDVDIEFANDQIVD